MKEMRCQQEGAQGNFDVRNSCIAGTTIGDVSQSNGIIQVIGARMMLQSLDYSSKYLQWRGKFGESLLSIRFSFYCGPAFQEICRVSPRPLQFSLRPQQSVVYSPA